MVREEVKKAVLAAASPLATQTSAELLRKVKRLGVRVSQRSVVRALNELAQIGLIRRVGVANCPLYVKEETGENR